MRILITGVAGFIGSHLADAFTELGHIVHGIDTYETGRRDNFPAAEMDIADRSLLYAVANALEPELVIHCAASYKDPNLWHRDTDTNVMGAINVAAVAKHHNARIIYFQTVLPPISSYAISKIAGEHYLRISGQPLTVFRLAAMYGPRNLSGAIPTFYRRIKAGEPCVVVRGVTRDFVYIDDLVRLVVQLAGTRSFAPEGTFEVRSGIETPIAALPQMIAQALGAETDVEYVERAADDVPNYEMTGPGLLSIDLDEGIARAVAWYEKHGVDETYTHLTLEGTR